MFIIHGFSRERRKHILRTEMFKKDVISYTKLRKSKFIQPHNE